MNQSFIVSIVCVAYNVFFIVYTIATIATTTPFQQILHVHTTITPVKNSKRLKHFSMYLIFYFFSKLLSLFDSLE